MTIATAQEPTPPEEDAVEAPWPPASTHGRFLPLPEKAKQPVTLPACDTEVTVAFGEGDESVHRVWVTDTGNTVIEYRGTAALDITRAFDGATLDEVELDGAGFQTVSAVGATETIDQFGPGLTMSASQVPRRPSWRPGRCTSRRGRASRTLETAVVHLLASDRSPVTGMGPRSAEVLMSDTTTSVSPTGSGAAGDRRQQVEQVISALNAHDAAKYASYYSPDAVVCTPASPEPLRGRSVIQQDTEEIFTAMPDWEVRVEEVVVDGPTAVSRAVAVGTHTGPMVMPSGEIPPSGRQVSTSMAIFSRLGEDGLIVEEHRYFDLLETLQQMGVA